MDSKGFLDSLNKTDVFLVHAIETQQRNFDRAISKMAARLNALAGQIEVSQMTGYVTGPDAWDFSRTATLLTQMENAYRKTYGRQSKEFGKALESLTEVIRTDFEPIGIRPEFSTFDEDFLSASREVAAAGFDAFGIQALNRVQQGLISLTAGASTFDEFIGEVDASLIGVEGAGGTPLTSYASRFAHDAIMDTYATMHKRKALEAGIDTFLYAGNVMAHTRQFCAARAGKVFTSEEIDAWNGLSWKGKRPGDVWINRGGYNCRHHFRAVLPGMIPEGGIEVGNYFTEPAS